MSEALAKARENRSSLREAIDNAEATLAASPGDHVHAWAADVDESLATLGRALEQHIVVTEAPGGLLEDMVAANPSLRERVSQTRDEHEQLRAQLGRIRASLTGRSTDVVAARRHVAELLTELIHHRQRGADLVSDAYGIPSDPEIPPPPRSH